MTCVKTGCALVMPDGQHIWGDMHCVRVGTLVFNGVQTREGKPLFAEGPLEERTPAYYLREHAQFFERRAVFVIDSDDLGYNRALAAYLELPLESARD